MRRRRVQNEQNTIDETDFMVTHNMTNLENLSDNENADVHHNEVEDEASLTPSSQQSRFEAQSTSKPKKVKGSDINDNPNKLSIAIESVTNSVIQSTTAMIEAS